MRVFEHFEYVLWRGWPVRGLPRLPNRTTIQQTLSPAPKTGPRSSWTRNGSGNFRESSGFLPGKPWPTNRGHGQQWLASAGHDTPWLAMASCGRLWLAMTHMKLGLDIGRSWRALAGPDRGGHDNVADSILASDFSSGNASGKRPHASGFFRECEFLNILLCQKPW